MILLPWQNRCSSEVLVCFDQTIATITTARQVRALGGEHTDVKSWAEKMPRSLFKDPERVSAASRETYMAMEKFMSLGVGQDDARAQSSACSSASERHTNLCSGE